MPALLGQPAYIIVAHSICLRAALTVYGGEEKKKEKEAGRDQVALVLWGQGKENRGRRELDSVRAL